MPSSACSKQPKCTAANRPVAARTKRRGTERRGTHIEEGSHFQEGLGSCPCEDAVWRTPALESGVTLVPGCEGPNNTSSLSPAASCGMDSKPGDRGMESCCHALCRHG